MLYEVITEQHLAIFLCGNKTQANWITPEQPTSFYDIKSQVENMLARLGLSTSDFKVNDVESDLFSEGLALTVGDKAAVEYGLVDSKLLKAFGIDTSIAYAEIRLDIRNNFV